MTAVDACIFDWGGTLTPWHNVDAVQPWLAAVGDRELAASLAAAENDVWIRCRDEHRSGSLAEIFDAAGISPTAEMFSAFHAFWEPHTLLDPDVAELFTALRERGIKIGVLSNTIWPRSVHESIFARDGVANLIDGAVYTCDIAWTKPHPQAFRAALDAVGVDDPARAVFVGDRVFDDIHGAKSVGMRAILVPHSDVPASQRGPVSGEPDAVVERLSDVLEHVDRWHRGA